MGEDHEIEAELETLKQEHRSLDAMIDDMEAESNAFNQLQLKRLKKRKLWLRDRMSHLLSELEPDIIA